jgi:hypothetical protein
MGQVHNFVMNGRGAPAIARAIMENDLIEEHHWLPQDIAKIPYRQLMMYYLIRRAKSNAMENKRKVDEVKRKEMERGEKASGHPTTSKTIRRR